MQNARAVWIAIREHLQARDEVTMAAMRLSFRELGQDSKSSRPISILTTKKGRARDPIFVKPKDTDIFEKFGHIASHEVHFLLFFI